jgi:hypothetical protein
MKTIRLYAVLVSVLALAVVPVALAGTAGIASAGSPSCRFVRPHLNVKQPIERQGMIATLYGKDLQNTYDVQYFYNSMSIGGARLLKRTESSVKFRVPQMEALLLYMGSAQYKVGIFVDTMPCNGGGIPISSNEVTAIVVTKSQM